MTDHEVVSRAAWLEARRGLLAEEKAFTRARDALTRRRQALPWERVTKPYTFEGARGRRTLADVFDGRSQLVVYHFMFGPDWQAGCPHCSRWADNFDNVIVHLNARDVTMVAISRAPYAKLAEYRRRMGWRFEWLSSHDSDFNFDYQVSFTAAEVAAKRGFLNYVEQDPGGSEREGVSVFFGDSDGQVYHTYSTYERGIDMLCVDYHYLDLVPKGRGEDGRGPYWVRRHDEYEG